MRVLALTAASAAALALASCGGGNGNGGSVPNSATKSTPASLAELPAGARAEVQQANAKIASYCAQASKSLDNPQGSLPTTATDGSLHKAVSSLIAVGKLHPKEMGPVLFQAQKTLQAGCYPSQGERLNAARLAIGG
ncbi:MAG: hypothetical protein ACJ76V_16370 [Thermoleophilaceae bacterium]